MQQYCRRRSENHHRQTIPRRRYYGKRIVSKSTLLRRKIARGLPRQVRSAAHPPHVQRGMG